MNDKIETVDEIHNRLMAYDDIKRECDEAREQANVMHEQWLSKGRCCENLAEELHEVKQQRDEAIARSKEWSDWCVEYKSERDELREALREILKVSESTSVLTYQKMEDIASKALKETK